MGVSSGLHGVLVRNRCLGGEKTRILRKNSTSRSFEKKKFACAQPGRRKKTVREAAQPQPIGKKGVDDERARGGNYTYAGRRRGNGRKGRVFFGDRSHLFRGGAGDQKSIKGKVIFPPAERAIRNNIIRKNGACDRNQTRRRGGGPG